VDRLAVAHPRDRSGARVHAELRKGVLQAAADGSRQIQSRSAI
jgi:hypothetical protein